MTDAAPARPRGGRVAIVLASLTMGGAEAQLATILEADPERLRRTRVTILTLLPTTGTLVERRLRALGIPIDTIDRGRHAFPAFLLALVRYFRRQRPDIVHTFLGGSTGTWGRIAARLAGVPAVLHSDLSLEPDLTRLQRVLEPHVHRLTTRFLPNAVAIARRLERQGVPPARIRLVRNGVDLERFAPRGRTPSADLPADAVVAGFLGMLRPEKRPDLLLAALLALAPERRPDRVVVAGDGPLMPELARTVASDPWLSAHVRLLGLVADTPDFLSGIDFLVLSSDTEGLPNAILEAMAMGLPCVATRVAEVPDLLGGTGLLVTPGDVQELADAIGRMTALPAAERRRLGALARERARADFGLAAAARRFWDAHDDLLPEGAR